MGKDINNEICSGVELLAEEMNFRLLLAQDWHYSVMVVESLTVTEISCQREMKSGPLSAVRKLFARTKRFFSGLIGKCRMWLSTKSQRKFSNNN